MAKVQAVKGPKAAKASNVLSGPDVASSGMDDYSKDPDKGERPYRDYETSEMANHVSKAVEILNHPQKKAAVMGHFNKQKQTIKSFEDLHKKIGQEME